jgi:hypothetical protein
MLFLPRLTHSTFFCNRFQVIDVLLVLDSLKDMKSSLQNDFSFFKRSFQFLRGRMGGQADSLQDEIHQMQMGVLQPALRHPANSGVSDSVGL